MLDFVRFSGKKARETFQTKIVTEFESADFLSKNLKFNSGIERFQQVS